MNGSILIGGIGNVLLGDDAVGPYVIRLLESEYTFPEIVEIVDLGTPALDLTHRIAGLRAVILVDCVRSDEHPPGTVLLYGQDDLVCPLPVIPAEASPSAVEGERSGGTSRLSLQSATLSQRVDPHSPSLSACLMTTEMLGASPEQVTLIGVVGKSFAPGCILSTAVETALDKTIHVILTELTRLNIWYERRRIRSNPDIWWSARQEVDFCF